MVLDFLDTNPEQFNSFHSNHLHSIGGRRFILLSKIPWSFMHMDFSRKCLNKMC